MPLLKKTSVGVDIADHSIEVVELQQSIFGGQPRVVSRSRMALSPGIVERGRVILRKQLGAALEELMSKAHPRPITARDIIFGIPERQVYTLVLRLDRERRQTLSDQIDRAARESIPLEHDDLVYRFRLLSESDHSYEILLYGMSKEVLIEWQDFFRSSPYTVRAYDHELLAVARGLLERGGSTPLGIVDIGAERTKIALFSSHGLHYVNSIDIAGDLFTERIAQSLTVTLDEAERQKRERGMESISFHGLLQDLLSPIIDEVRTACALFEKREGAPITEVILVGGSARLKGLPEYVQEQIGRPCRRGAPTLPLGNGGEQQDSLHYIEAIGLAMRGLDPRYWERRDPALPQVSVEAS